MDDFGAAFREWQPLLKILLHHRPSSPSSCESAVGSAIHWVRSRGHAGPRSQPSSLWQLVPHVLSARVITFERHSSAIGKCLWMQTLPTMAQINILAFLSSEKHMFLSKDLEILALEILSAPKLDFWIRHGAETLLSTVGSCSSSVEAKEVVPLPNFLCQGDIQRVPVLPWLSLSRTISSKFGNEIAQEQKLPSDNLRKPENINVLDAEGNEGRKPRNDDAMHNEDNMIALGTPPRVDEGRNSVFKDQAAVSIINASGSSSEDARMLPHSVVTHEDDIHSLAQSLREAWLERRPTLDDLKILQALVNPTEFFNILMPWTMDDDFVLSAIETFVTKDTGYIWSAQIMGFFLVPKLLQLERPASRFLVSAVMQAVVVHTRAAIDAIFLPLVLIDKGLNDAQSDVLNRTIKEFLADHHLLSFFEKMFIQSKRHQLPIFTQSEGLCVQKSIWSEAFCSMVQNLLSRIGSMDEELIQVFVSACNDEVRSLSKSLKFSNLLLCLISKFGQQLKPHHVTLERIVQKTQTFMTKSLITKLSMLSYAET